MSVSALRRLASASCALHEPVREEDMQEERKAVSNQPPSEKMG
jgi:hypothetical protein